MKKILYNIALILAAIAAAAFIGLTARDSGDGRPEHDAQTITASVRTVPTLIIDAGHGGMDSGAVSDSGTRESDINLDIAQRLDMLMGFLGVNTVMTRDSDDLAYSERANTIRQKKVEDTRRRVDLINSTENAVLISIHQNKYPSGDPFGAQVLYARTPGSQELAKSMQALLISSLNPRSYRVAAPIPGSVYMMNNIKPTALLIECGFLSNSEEEALLKTPEYRLKIAATIAAGFLRYI